jgi:sporulation protein YlmC with PRC-barrel domain
MPVKDAGGRTLGVVDELRIDDMTGELRAIVVRDGGLAHAAQTNDTSKTHEIPADHLDIGDGEVHVIEEVPGHVAGRDT